MVTVPDRPKVLVIDDDPGMLGKLEAMLDTWGFRAVTASNADTAFELLVQDEEVHIVVVDYMLPGMNGFELCRKIRAKLHSTPLHLLILTAKAGKQQLVEGLGAGADDFLSKPFHPDELRARLLAGARSAKVQAELRRQIGQYEAALRRLGQALQFLPRCEGCKKKSATSTATGTSSRFRFRSARRRLRNTSSLARSARQKRRPHRLLKLLRSSRQNPRRLLLRHRRRRHHRRRVPEGCPSR